MRSPMSARAAAPLLTLLALTLATPLSVGAQDEPEASPPTEDAPAQVTASVEDGQPRYLEAMNRELRAMRVAGASCEATDAERARCSFTARGITTGREFAVRLVYSDQTDTIYFYVERYLMAPASDEHTGAVLRRLMELNWSLLLGKFEWDASDGEVRLAMLMNTDSNFDRRAFRSIIRSIGQVADRYWAELAALGE